MKKRLLIFTIIIYGMNFNITFSACEYQSEIDQCVQANINEGAKEITDFICADTDSREEIAYQIIFDKKLKEIDKDAENYLTTLQNSIQYYYGPEKKESYLDGINYINELFTQNGTLWKRYNKYCVPKEENSIISDYIECLTGDENTKKGNVLAGSSYFSASICKEIVEFKLFVYKKTAYNLLQVNKLDFLKDFRKKQLKSTKEKYDEIVGNMHANLDHIIRINKQREKVTKQCQYIAPDP